LALYLAALTTRGANPPPLAPELQRLQGTWQGVMVGDKAGKITITVTNDSFRFYRDKGFWFDTKITLPPGTNPQQLRATIIDCAPPPSPIGQVVIAIFKIEDGNLTLATGGGEEDETPLTFENFEERGGNRYEFRKAQPQDKAQAPDKCQPLDKCKPSDKCQPMDKCQTSEEILPFDKIFPLPNFNQPVTPKIR
jgi:uncharacterized protein (TIGR03067 family)